MFGHFTKHLEVTPEEYKTLRSGKAYMALLAGKLLTFFKYKTAKPKPTPLSLQNGTRLVGRNDPCPCGSGKKYKACCGADAKGE